MLRAIKSNVRKRVPQKSINRFHLFEAIWANIRYRFPARGMLVVGITGTKGKTTTSHYVASILEEAGFKVGMATTAVFKIGDEVWANESNKSVLHPMELQALLRRMKDERCDAAVVEVTSHSLDQHRVWGIPFRFVGFTNLSHDHLDYHETMEHYRDSKLKLFHWRSARACAINADDPVGQYILDRTKIRRRWSYSMETDIPYPSATDHAWVSRVSANSTSATFTLHTGLEEARVQLQLPGRFNIENALCAAALCSNLNVKLGTVVAGLEKVTRVPGRLEKIETNKGFSVIIDYAHTPDSLEKLYSTLRPDIRGKMIAILGATGDRDRTKRPIMGALAARFCDVVILTDEEPYTEDPLAIIEEIAKGVPRGRTLFRPSQKELQRREKERTVFRKDDESGEGEWWWKEPDRAKAIAQAIDLCRMDDVVLVTGMGAQTSKYVGDEKVPWDDREVVERILRAKKLL
ncbi:MAG TPA: UDP-N-acetylmuramoyl-L-alanyl-D-glutamate--2,6-diaminopimelate ligase [Verrucomicrobiae bacterium]|nr:UDP-N-acetylmuramoyl-L-alanyl-D-glutamate--2,6-diaminopimelate ligase [Verrucomicrobiae bacterium]